MPQPPTPSVSLLTLALALTNAIAFAESYPSHAPMRPLPVSAQSTLPAGARHFVDPRHGQDSNAGTEEAPWQTLAFALHALKPGDTLLLRAGVYYEKPALTRSGTAEAPITIASYPGELAIIDGGLREFAESPATSWEPFAGGAEGEFVSTKTYPGTDARRVPNQFVPAQWEPMWNLEDDRPLALGDFADSMIPLHGYRSADDLRSANEFWLRNKSGDAPLYCGPGLWFNRDTRRLHIRLAPTKLEGLGARAYQGETDPRKLALVVALGFGDDVLRLTGIKNVHLSNLVFRGATGSPMISIYGSENIELDHVTIFGGFPGLLVNATKNLRVTHTAVRSNAAPWSSRAHMKYRGTASYAIVLRNDLPINENIEFGNCEFTDGHDFAFLRFAKNLQFHHNFVDNFNDDGLECGPKVRDHSIFIYENRLGGLLSPFTGHQGAKDESPLDHDANTGLYVYRNIIDLRAGTYSTPPAQSDSSGKFLHTEGHLVGDHGNTIWPVMRFYHNTVVRQTPTFRDYFLFGLGVQGLANSERDVFNNIFLQVQGVPGTGTSGIRTAGNIREGGNILWTAGDEPSLKGDPFAKFRASAYFIESKKYYEPGLTTKDRVVNPGLNGVDDLRLHADAAALNSGLPIPKGWPDRFHDADPDAPDIGAVPLGATLWTVGIDGRIPLFDAAK